MEELTQDTFEDTIGTGMAVVDFWAPWCGPCKMFAPTFAEVAEERTDITFAKVNTEDQPEIAQDARIRAIPTLIFFKDGEEVHRQSGAMQKSDFIALLDEIFKE